MESDKIIKNSIYYYNSRKYGEVIKLLEKKIFFFKNNYFYHYLLGLAYLRIGNLASAQTYLKKAYTLGPSEPDIKQVIAILLVAQGKEDKAIQIWLKMIEENQEIVRTELSLETIRKNPIEGTIFFKNNKLYEKIFPEVKAELSENFIKSIKVFIVLGFIILFSSMGFFLVHQKKISLKIFSSENQTKKVSNDIAAYIDDINIDSKEKIANNEGQFVFVLTSDEIKSSFEKIKNYLKDGKDNFARVEINKILNSNSSESIKLKAKNLASFIVTPDFINFNDYLTLSDIKKNPFIYNEVYAKWQGIVNNIEKKSDEIYFDFYIGYNKNVLDGIIFTKVNFDIDIDFKDPVEILGQIEYKKGELILNAITIRKIGKKGEFK